MADNNKENIIKDSAPKSAHATPVAENYVGDRIEKAEQQIEQEEKDKDESSPKSSNLSSTGFGTSYYAIF